MGGFRSYCGGIPPPLGGGFLSERSERNQRIAGGRLSLDALRPNSPYPRTPVYGGRPLLALWPRPARAASGRPLLLTRCRSPQSPGWAALPVYSAPRRCNIHPFCRARRPGGPFVPRRRIGRRASEQGGAVGSKFCTGAAAGGGAAAINISAARRMESANGPRESKGKFLETAGF